MGQKGKREPTFLLLSPPSSTNEFYLKESRGTNFKRQSGGSWSVKREERRRWEADRRCACCAVQVSAQKRLNKRSLFRFAWFLCLQTPAVCIQCFSCLPVLCACVRVGGELSDWLTASAPSPLSTVQPVSPQPSQSTETPAAPFSAAHGNCYSSDVHMHTRVEGGQTLRT